MAFLNEGNERVERVDPVLGAVKVRLAVQARAEQFKAMVKQHKRGGEGAQVINGGEILAVWAGGQPRSTKLSITRFSPAFSKSTVSLLPSTWVTMP